jgi:hypothetical protein
MPRRMMLESILDDFAPLGERSASRSSMTVENLLARA